MDKFKEALKTATQLLKKCQEEKGVKSCLKCKEVIGCKIRQDYVDAVYKSMNKGRSGGFDF